MSEISSSWSYRILSLIWILNSKMRPFWSNPIGVHYFNLDKGKKSLKSDSTRQKQN